MGELAPVRRLEARQEIESAVVEGSMAAAAERHHAIRVVAAALRSRNQMSRIDAPAPAARDATLADDLGPLRVRCGAEARPAERRLEGCAKRPPSEARAALHTV